MGQSASTAAITSRRESTHSQRYKSNSTAMISPMQLGYSTDELIDGASDYISNLPDDCLACIFQSLGSGDRNRCSLVCKRWFRIEGQSRHHLSLKAESDLLHAIPSLFSRFDVVTKLALKCERRSVSIGDDALILISLKCKNLTRLKLRACRELTDDGISAFAKNCKGLKKLSCGSCTFGAKGMNAVLDNCSTLEELSVKRLRGITDGGAAEPIGPGTVSASLKTICLKELYNGQSFGPLIIGAKNLRTLKLFKCSGDWDKLLQLVTDRVTSLVEIHLDRIQVTDVGMNAVLDNCSILEDLSVKRLQGITDGGAAEPIGPVAASASLKTICLKELYNGQCFGPLIIGAKNLRTLKLFRCPGDWDKLLQLVTDRVTSLVEIHLERIQVTDVGLAAISNCLDLEILHLVKTPECTNLGLSALANRCKLLRKLHIDGWKANRIGDEGLMTVAKYCRNLQELVLIGVNPTKLSLELLATNCQNLERLALCGSDTVGDMEISCIAAKCLALRKLCIKSCPVSDHGMEALASGCPNLVKVKVKKCRGVTTGGAEWLRAQRQCIVVNLDSGEPEHQDASDGGMVENGIEYHPHMVPVNIASSSNTRSTSFKSRLGLLSGRGFVACTLRRWSSGNSSSRNS